jgi:hypothetical protein
MTGIVLCIATPDVYTFMPAYAECYCLSTPINPLGHHSLLMNGSYGVSLPSDLYESIWTKQQLLMRWVRRSPERSLTY